MRTTILLTTVATAVLALGQTATARRTALVKPHGGLVAAATPPLPAPALSAADAGVVAAPTPGDGVVWTLAKEQSLAEAGTRQEVGGGWADAPAPAPVNGATVDAPVSAAPADGSGPAAVLLAVEPDAVPSSSVPFDAEPSSSVIPDAEPSSSVTPDAQPSSPAPDAAPDAALDAPPPSASKPRGVLGPAFVLDLWQLAARGQDEADVSEPTAEDGDTTAWVATSTPSNEEGGAPTVYLVPSGQEEETGVEVVVDAPPSTIRDPAPSLSFSGGFVIDLPALFGGSGENDNEAPDVLPTKDAIDEVADVLPTAADAVESHAAAWLKVLGGGKVGGAVGKVGGAVGSDVPS